MDKHIDIEKLFIFENLYKIINTSTLDELLMLSLSYKVQINKLQNVRINVDAARVHVHSTYVNLFKNKLAGSAVLFDTILDLKENIEQYKWLYNILEDKNSKTTLTCIMLYRMFGDLNFIGACYDKRKHYFDVDILPKVENEVFIDAGSCDGKDSISFIDIYGDDYKKIYTYEPSLDNYKNIVHNLAKYPRIEHCMRGISDKKGEMFFTSYMPASANRLHSEWGDIKVDISTIDFDIIEPVTFIKMDIEGAEQAALYGSKRHISEDTPKMAICLYHTVDDIWKIPRIIYSFNPNYKFYMRQHELNTPWELVLYTAPKFLFHSADLPACKMEVTSSNEAIRSSKSSQNNQAESSENEKYYEIINYIFPLLSTMQEAILYIAGKLPETECTESVTVLGDVLGAISGIENAMSSVPLRAEDNSREVLSGTLKENIGRLIISYEQNKDIDLRPELSEEIFTAFMGWMNEIQKELKSE